MGAPKFIFQVVVTYYTILQLDNIVDKPSWTYNDESYTLPLSRLGDACLAIILFVIVFVFITDLLIHACDVYVVCCLLINQKYWHKSLNESAKKFQPALMRWICDSWFFFPYQLVVRYGPAHLVASAHCCVMCVTCFFSNFHTWKLFDISLAGLKSMAMNAAILMNR
mmetsp:Transcript_18825/g.36867  ORF Transcript_18825/g.36867 Transcript_18825/m.36867 type:complete len:167 (-) Transcript_18825:253-753(-)